MTDTDACRAMIRQMASLLDELSHAQAKSIPQGQDGDYWRGSRDAYKDAARRVRGLADSIL